MYNYAFVILHYGLYEKTARCIDNLTQKTAEDSLIVVVDNGSPDGSGNILLKKYKNDPGIKVILLKNNLGFSKGVNKGYQYAKTEGCKFIALINNDTEILTDKLYITRLTKSQFEAYLNQCNVNRAELDSMKGSTSWRITSPFRSISKKMRTRGRS